MQAARNDLGQRTPWVGSAGLLLSLGVHAAVFAALGTFQLDPQAAASVSPVEISVIDTPPPPEPELAPAPEPPAPAPEPEPEPVKPPPPPKVRERAPKPVDVPPPEQATPPPAAAQAETIADFSGTTLTGEGQGGWLSAVGTGGTMNGPIGRPGALVTGRNREGVAAGGVIDGTGVRLVGESDLSRRPKLPNDALNAALERNYPKVARQQGIEGTASIRVRILANGKIEPLRKEGALAAAGADTWGFGDACLKTLKEVAQQHRVEQTPLDRQGKPAATEIRFKCTFTVE